MRPPPSLYFFQRIPLLSSLLGISRFHYPRARKFARRVERFQDCIIIILFGEWNNCEWPLCTEKRQTDKKVTIKLAKQYQFHCTARFS
jgi:hypothetical protein